MSSTSHNVPFRRSKILGAIMSPEAVEVQGYFCDAVSAEMGDGRARAIHNIARSTGLTERRVVGIMRAEVKRIWADELRKVREWREDWCLRREARLGHEIEMLRARRAKIGSV